MSRNGEIVRRTQCSLSKRATAVLLILALVLAISAHAPWIPALAAYAEPGITLSSLARNGSATMGPNSELRLTTDRWQAGSAWYGIKQDVASGFTTTFEFRVTRFPNEPAADGFAFVIQNSPRGTGALGANAACLGIYYESPPWVCGNGYVGNALAVEFDTASSWGFDDYTSAANHISVYGSATALQPWLYTRLAPEPRNPGFHIADGAVHKVKIVYVPGVSGAPGTLQIFADDLSTALFTISVDIASRIGLASDGLAYMGFTGGTGPNRQTADILKWTIGKPADSTPPTLRLPTDITAEAAGPSGTLVSFNPSATDDLDGAVAVTCTPPSGSTFQLGTTSVSCSATDAAGNATLGAFNVIIRDTVLPSIAPSATTKDGNDNTIPYVADTWTNRDVIVTFACSDSGSGIDSCPPDVLVSGDGAAQSASGTAVDRAGNTASATFGPVKVDKTAPMVVYTGNQDSYMPDQVVDIKCAATDNLSGVASDACADIKGPAYSFNLGANAYSATATDNAGNAGSGSASFTVQVTANSLNNVVDQFVTGAGQANSLKTKVDAIQNARNANAKAGVLRAFTNEVSAQTGKSLNADQAATLNRLAGRLAAN